MRGPLARPGAGDRCHSGLVEVLVLRLHSSQRRALCGDYPHVVAQVRQNARGAFAGKPPAYAGLEQRRRLLPAVAHDLYQLPAHSGIVEAGQQRAVDVEGVEVPDDLHAQGEAGASPLAPGLSVGAEMHALQQGQVELAPQNGHRLRPELGGRGGASVPRHVLPRDLAPRSDLPE